MKILEKELWSKYICIKLNYFFVFKEKFHILVDFIDMRKFDKLFFSKQILAISLSIIVINNYKKINKLINIVFILKKTIAVFFLNH